MTPQTTGLAFTLLGVLAAVIGSITHLTGITAATGPAFTVAITFTLTGLLLMAPGNKTR